MTELTLKTEKTLDPIKDAIDEGLRRIRSAKQRKAAAEDLIEYLKLHYAETYD